MRMTVGETRRFRVVTAPGFYTGWTQPTSNERQTIALSHIHDTFRHGVSYRCLVSGTVTGLMPGVAFVETGTDTQCFHLHDPCLAPAVGWRLKVRVAAPRP